MNPEQWLSLKWNGGSTMSDRWLNQSKIIHMENVIDYYKKDCYEKKLFFELVEYQKKFFKENIKIQLLTGYFYTNYLFI